MVMRSKNKPPLARSPIQLRSRRKTLEPTISTANHSPPGPNPTRRSQQHPPTRSWDAQRSSKVRPEYQTMSSELTTLFKKMQEEFGPKDAPTSDNDVVSGAGRSCPLQYERGRLYDEYSAMRNEKLKRKKVEMMEEEGYEKEPQCGDDDDNAGAGAGAEASKKREKKKTDASASLVVERERYSLSSSGGGGSKENKKPPVAKKTDASASLVVERERYSLRSSGGGGGSKENKKPLVAEKSQVGVRRTRRAC